MLNFPFWKKALIIAISLLAMIVASPNLISKEARERLPGWMPSQGVSLGLDLQGGAHLLVEAKVDDVYKARMLQLSKDMMRPALLAGGVTRRDPPVTAEDRVTIGGFLPEEMDKAETALKGLAQNIGGPLSSVMDLDVQRVEGANAFRVTLSEAAKTQLADRTIQQSLEVVRRRIDPNGTTEATIQRQGASRILVQVPGVKDASAIKKLLENAAVLSFHTVDLTRSPDDLAKGIRKPDTIILPDAEEPGRLWAVSETPLINGTEVASASPGYDDRTSEAIVAFRFTTAAGKKFADFTRANVGKPFAIVLDGKVLSAPNIREPILGGSGQISGRFTTESATRLATQISAGALPAGMVFLEERTVGPELGADSIAAGKMASLVGSALVVGLMLAMYGLFGVIATIALAINVIMIFAVMSLIGSTLTLPGVAGIVLTVGMAVDANVLIYERIREEIQAGKPLVRAIDIGFEKALAAIIDSNVTTLIAALILYMLGAGPIRGFAVTLAVGLGTSMFTAVYLTRLMVAAWYDARRPKTAKIALFQLVPPGTRLRFTAWRRPAIFGSFALALLGMAVLPLKGLNMGIDFAGGAMFETRTEPTADIAKIREVMNGLNLGEVAVQGFGDPRDVMIRVEAASDDAAMAQVVKTATETLKAQVQGLEVRRVETVGPKVSGELIWGGVGALALSILAVMVYLWLRFEWQFAVGAAIATLHDVFITTGLIALMGLEFNLTIIAALLTLVGYSLNDTVIVYDRIRENLRKYKTMPLDQLIDLSTNETLARTLMTSITTLLALLGLYLFGGESIHGFATTMLWGVVIGTYSSIYVASPALMWLGVKRDWSKESDKGAGVKFGGAEARP